MFKKMNVFILLLHQLRVTKERKISGFTLIELLVSMAVATIVVSALTSLTVLLLSTNQQESGQTQTQSDMQLALDYISADLREAVYVYSGDCLQGKGSVGNPDFCPGVINYIRVPPTNSVPILAFWKLDSLPKILQQNCGSSTPPASVPCTAGRTYTLVVYLLAKNDPSANPRRWYGQARLLRYELPKYKADGTETANYVNPEEPGVGFRKWPYRTQGGTTSSLQTAKPTNKFADVLVDFVDGTPRTGDSTVSCPPDDTVNNIYYSLSPPNPAAPFASTRSFYTCIKVDKTIEKNATGASFTVYDGKGLNQDILVFLRGNAEGRVQNSSSNNLPTLSAQVLRRSIVNKDPRAIQ